jgi:hypothetical protein
MNYERTCEKRMNDELKQSNSKLNLTLCITGNLWQKSPERIPHPTTAL